ncbi:putative RNA recognition motif domain, nucleotide-binding alpha-beta plait domain superfamily [Helianthus annuus]|nr:putative RNA recognition motif domain, nucleotide-binding alpha-beta plait domain superfamily [Helianthus annuus]
MGRGPWHEDHYRKQRRATEKEITFYVANLPDRTSNTLLGRAFQPFGTLTDAYVAKKRDSRGNCFGFVRYVGVNDIQEVLRSMNTVKIYEAKLSVSLAKYNKDHQKFNHQEPPIGRQTWVPKATIPPASTGVKEGRMYSDALKGQVKVVQVEGPGPCYPNHCMGRSVLGVVRSLRTLDSIDQVFQSGVFTNVSLSYVGGMTVMVTFKDRGTATKFLEEGRQFWSSFFSKAKIWNGEDMDFGRIAKLVIHGVPLLIRDKSVYESVGALFGEIVQRSDFSWENMDVAEGSCFILTKSGGRIEEEVVVQWKGQSHRVWVSEEAPAWKPSFGELQSVKVSEWKENIIESTAEEAELEEGELRCSVRRVNPMAGRRSVSRYRKTNRLQAPLQSWKTSCMGTLIRLLEFRDNNMMGE